MQLTVMALPDWRAGNDYQALLGAALAKEGIDVIYPSGTRRLLPMARTATAGASLLHLHWPEAFFPRRRDGLDWLRVWRFSLDLRLATRHLPFVYTAHNFLPHDRANSAVLKLAYRQILRRAAGVIAHSAAAANQLAAVEPSVHSHLYVIPHGDLADAFPSLPPRRDSRVALGLRPDDLVVLMFGRIKPYKGIVEVIQDWATLHPSAHLWVSGPCDDPHFGDSVKALASRCDRVHVELGHLDHRNLALRIAAADIVLFNYIEAFTSGAVCLARSLGKTIVLPEHLSTIDVGGQTDAVLRFRSVRHDLAEILAQAAGLRPTSASTSDWRRETSWRLVATRTREVYQITVASRRC